MTRVESSNANRCQLVTVEPCELLVDVGSLPAFNPHQHKP
jgi:hypothetical protein